MPNTNRRMLCMALGAAASLLASCTRTPETKETALQDPVSSVSCDIDLSQPIIVPKNPRKEGDTVKHAYRLADGSIVFLGRFTLDADGHPKAYGPNNSGLDDTANAGRPGNWYALATDARNCDRTGNLLVQNQSDPAPGYYVSKTSVTAGRDCRRQANYVHSGEIPYVALPPAIAKISGNRGRLVAVATSHASKLGFAFHADIAPAYGIGEGSMKLATELGLRNNPRNGGLEERKLVYVVLPENLGFPRDAAQVEATTRSAFDAWGGATRLKKCEGALLAAPK